MFLLLTHLKMKKQIQNHFDFSMYFVKTIFFLKVFLNSLICFHHETTKQTDITTKKCKKSIKTHNDSM